MRTEPVYLRPFLLLSCLLLLACQIDESPSDLGEELDLNHPLIQFRVNNNPAAGQTSVVECVVDEGRWFDYTYEWDLGACSFQLELNDRQAVFTPPAGMLQVPVHVIVSDGEEEMHKLRVFEIDQPGPPVARIVPQDTTLERESWVEFHAFLFDSRFPTRYYWQNSPVASGSTYMWWPAALVTQPVVLRTVNAHSSQVDTAWVHFANVAPMITYFDAGEFVALTNEFRSLTLIARDENLDTLSVEWNLENCELLSVDRFPPVEEWRFEAELQFSASPGTARIEAIVSDGIAEDNVIVEIQIEEP